MKNLIFAVFGLFLIVSCGTQKSSNSSVDNRPQQGQRQGPPTTDEIFKMDGNNDGKLTKSELSGPLLNDFEKIDTNNDGFLTRKEVENAPKPQRGQGPRKN